MNRSYLNLRSLDLKFINQGYGLIDHVNFHTRLLPLYIFSHVKLVMYIDSKIRKDYLFIVAVISTLIFSIRTLVNGFTNVTYGQTNATQANSTSNVPTNLVNIQNIPLEKVHVGDIEMGYKMFVRVTPLYFIMVLMMAWMHGTQPF